MNGSKHLKLHSRKPSHVYNSLKTTFLDSRDLLPFYFGKTTKFILKKNYLFYAFKFIFLHITKFITEYSVIVIINYS